MKTRLKKTLIILLALVFAAHCAADGILPVNSETARRQSIDDNYHAAMQQLYAEAEQEANKLNVTDRLLWIEFITGDETPYSDSFSLYTVGGGDGFLSFSSSVTMNEELLTSNLLIASTTESHAHKLSTLTGPQRHLQANLANGYSLQTFAMFLLNAESVSLFKSVAQSRFQNRSFRYQARQLHRTAKRLQIEARHIEAERNARLARLNRAQSFEMPTIETQAAQPAPDKFGVVSAISYSPGNSFCMIDGIDKMLKAGDSANGIKAVSIDRESVEFQRKRKTWTQKIGAEPDSAWAK